MVNCWAVIVPPTNKFPPTPIPPATVNAPVLVLVLAVKLLILTVAVVVPENIPVCPCNP